MSIPSFQSNHQPNQHVVNLNDDIPDEQSGSRSRQYEYRQDTGTAVPSLAPPLAPTNDPSIPRARQSKPRNRVRVNSKPIPISPPSSIASPLPSSSPAYPKSESRDTRQERERGIDEEEYGYGNEEGDRAVGVIRGDDQPGEGEFLSKDAHAAEGDDEFLGLGKNRNHRNGVDHRIAKENAFANRNDPIDVALGTDTGVAVSGTSEPTHLSEKQPQPSRPGRDPSPREPSRAAVYPPHAQNQTEKARQKRNTKPEGVISTGDKDGKTSEEGKQEKTPGWKRLRDKVLGHRLISWIWPKVTDFESMKPVIRCAVAVSFIRLSPVLFFVCAMALTYDISDGCSMRCFGGGGGVM